MHKSSKIISTKVKKILIIKKQMAITFYKNNKSQKSTFFVWIVTINKTKLNKQASRVTKKEIRIKLKIINWIKEKT